MLKGAILTISQIHSKSKYGAAFKGSNRKLLLSVAAVSEIDQLAMQLAVEIGSSGTRCALRFKLLALRA